VEVRDFEEWLRRGVENEQCLGFLNDTDILDPAENHVAFRMG
jgi:hypothetical protein